MGSGSNSRRYSVTPDKYLTMRSFCLLLTCSLILIGSTLAQDLSQRDVLYLTNGWVLRGTLVERGDSVGITLSEGSYFQFHQKDVLRKSTEPWQKPQAMVQVLPKAPPKPPFVYPGNQPGYYWGFATTLLMGQDGYYNGTASLDLTLYNGYRLARQLQLGGGMGFSLYGWGPLMPVFAEIRGELLPNQNTPHYFARAGYNVPLYRNRGINTWDVNTLTSSKTKGGLMVEVGAGVNVYTRGGTGWLFAFSYRYQQVTDYYQNWNNMPVTRRNGYRRLGFQIGLLF
jgi:opacity protein-like surface antigen